ncbi:MAG: dNTP triphosphohydrolase [Bryobacterales bacterium]|nr:dNTP triphosphohydrolase [Bryobacterales bacterium]
MSSSAEGPDQGSASLARLRFPLSSSRGRRYPELSHRYRSEFQRDRDRIVHSRAFRRLEDKTQVFSDPQSDHFRTRLTHTLEVAQIARTVAATLQLDEEFTEALALAHDLGHPPYAHAGECELDRLMQSFGNRFDHNFQALRIVELIERRYAMFPGLNLTFELREGIVKHSHDLIPGEHPFLDEYLPGVLPPLEAQIIDLADEIAYNTADLDDARDADILTWEAIRESVAKFDELARRVEQQYAGAPLREQFVETLRALLDFLATGLIEGTYQAALDAGVESAEEVRRHSTRLARYSAEAAEANAALKRFLRERVYNSTEILEARVRCEAEIRSLFHFFLENPSAISASFREYHETEAPHRLVCDYIAGMTDGFFRKTFLRLLGPEN